MKTAIITLLALGTISLSPINAMDPAALDAIDAQAKTENENGLSYNAKVRKNIKIYQALGNIHNIAKELEEVLDLDRHFYELSVYKYHADSLVPEFGTQIKLIDPTRCLIKAIQQLSEQDSTNKELLMNVINGIPSFNLKYAAITNANLPESAKADASLNGIVTDKTDSYKNRMLAEAMRLQNSSANQKP